MDKEISLAIMGCVLAVAALLLVFAGFLFARADQFDGSVRGDKYRTLARLGLIPLVASIVCTWISLQAAKGSPWALLHLELAFDLVLGLTALYAVVSLLLAK